MSIKILTDFFSVLSHCTRLSDRRADVQTDTFLVASRRWHSMERGKKLVKGRNLDISDQLHYYINLT